MRKNTLRTKYSYRRIVLNLVIDINKIYIYRSFLVLLGVKTKIEGAVPLPHSSCDHDKLVNTVDNVLFVYVILGKFKLYYYGNKVLMLNVKSSMLNA